MKIGGLTDVIKTCTSTIDCHINANTSELPKVIPENDLFNKNAGPFDANPGPSTRRNKRRRSFNKNYETASNDVLHPTVQVLLPPSEVKEELIDEDNCLDNSYPPEENGNFSATYEEEYSISQSDNEMHSDAASSSQVWTSHHLFIGLLLIWCQGLIYRI